jgi:hypothetical protein
MSRSFANTSGGTDPPVDHRAGESRAGALTGFLLPAFTRLGTADHLVDPNALHEKLQSQTADCDALWEEYGELARQMSKLEPATERESWWRRWVVAPMTWPPLVVVLVGAWVGVSYWWFDTHPGWRESWFQGFCVLLPTLLPAFLYMRFLRYRLWPIRIEYVFNLHRLGCDRPGALPEPPVGTDFWLSWFLDGGLFRGARRDNIYRIKFMTHYSIWPVSDRLRYRENLGNLMSVYIATAVVGVGWSAVVWGVGTPTRLSQALEFAFLGAYFFILSMLIRRFYQNDLRPAAYMAAIVRVITALLIVAAIDQLFAGGGDQTPAAPENVVAFLVGIFPTTGIQLLRKSAGKALKVLTSDGLEPPFRLGQLDGLDVWTEARLLEVGVEDAQHLAHANIIDLSLATRFPMQRLVDWVDQALLLVHAGMPRKENVSDADAPETTYDALRRIGLRTATQVLAFSDKAGLTLKGIASPWPTESTGAIGMLATGDDSQRVSLLTRIAIIADGVRGEPNINLIRNWRKDRPHTADGDGGAADQPQPSDVSANGQTSLPAPGTVSTTVVASSSVSHDHGVLVHAVIWARRTGRTLWVAATEPYPDGPPGNHRAASRGTNSQARH